MTTQFPFFDLSRQYKEIKSEVLDVVSKVMESQIYVGGEHVKLLEEEAARYVGCKHSVTCSSGTDALVVALKALDIGPGDEVITTPFSFFASTSSILLTGATPVFTDIELDTYNLDPAKVEKAITPKTKAIMVVHLFGQCANMAPFLEIAKKHNLKLIEDFAQSIGAKCPSGSAGAMGDVGATSFYPTKNLGGAGEGGLVTTNDSGLAERLKLTTVHGMKVRYTHDLLGWNSRLDSVQAAVLRIKLRRLDEWVAKRNKNADRYRELLGGLESKGKIKLPKAMAGNRHVWNQYVVMIENRDQVRQKLTEQGVPTDIFYPKTITNQPVLKAMGYSDEPTPIAAKAAAQALALPIFPELTEAEQDLVVNQLRNIL